MMSWAFVNLKPGVGKTTSAVFLAHALMRQGVKPLLVDCDPGQSALRWADLAGGFDFPIIGLPTATVHKELEHHTGTVEAVVLDAPQLEDHARIARGAMRFADTWVSPVAPSGIEIDRMSKVQEHFDDVQSLRAEPADVAVLLNRTNRPHRTKTGPDAEVREVLIDRGYHVLDTQIQHLDDYRQQFGLTDIQNPTYEALATELLDRAKAAKA